MYWRSIDDLKEVTDSRSAPCVKLGNVLGQGGFGAVYPDPGQPDQVVKRVRLDQHTRAEFPFILSDAKAEAWAAYRNRCDLDKFLVEVSVLEVASRYDIAVPLVGWSLCREAGRLFGLIIMKKGADWDVLAVPDEKWRSLIVRLNRMHALGIWHQDLFPKNIMMYQNELYVIDFGMAVPKLNGLTKAQRLSDFFSLFYGSVYNGGRYEGVYRQPTLQFITHPLKEYIVSQTENQSVGFGSLRDYVYEARVYNSVMGDPKTCDMDRLYADDHAAYAWFGVIHPDRLCDNWNKYACRFMPPPAPPAEDVDPPVLRPIYDVVTMWKGRALERVGPQLVVQGRLRRSSVRRKSRLSVRRQKKLNR